MELGVALVQYVLDREPAALEVRRDVVGLPVEVVVGILDEIVRLGPREAYDGYDDAWNERCARRGVQRERLEPVWLETSVDEVVCCECTLAGDLGLIRIVFSNSWIMKNVFQAGEKPVRLENLLYKSNGS